MNLAKRVFLYLFTNFLVVATLSLVTNALGLHGYLTNQGIDYHALAAICLVWGMTSSLVSLFLSRWMAKVTVGVQLVNPATHIGKEQELIRIVYRLARRVGLGVMPEVGIYESDELNAFATGPTKNRALIAVSSGLLQKMSHDELEGTLGHEVSHIANGDMVTMTLLQGIVNAFSLFLSRVIAYALREFMDRQESRRGRRPSVFLYSILVLIFDIFIMFLGSIVVAAFSRYREYRADAGSARLVGRQKMILALERLRSAVVVADQEADLVTSLKINNKRRRFWSLLASHPDIDDRIAALRA